MVSASLELEFGDCPLSSDLRGENKIRFPATKPAVTMIAAATSRAWTTQHQMISSID